MRIGFVELLLILLIASLTIGPSAALWVDRWLRRANRASAAAARRRAVQEAQRAAEREEVLQRVPEIEHRVYAGRGCCAGLGAGAPAH